MLKDIVWLIRNGYKDVTEEMKQKGFNPPVANVWLECSLEDRKFVTVNGKFYEKE